MRVVGGWRSRGPGPWKRGPDSSGCRPVTRECAWGTGWTMWTWHGAARVLGNGAVVCPSGGTACPCQPVYLFFPFVFGASGDLPLIGFVSLQV